MFNSGKTKWKEDFESKAYFHAAKLYRLAYARLGNAQDAEDAVQETYIKAFRSYQSFRQGANLEAWLVTILINNIRDHLRRVHKMSKTISVSSSEAEDLDIADRSSGPEELYAANELNQSVLYALKSIPENMSMPLLLREIHDMSYKDIAEILDLPIGTVMSRLSRARQLLRSTLSERIEKPTGQNESPKQENAEDKL